MVLVFLLRSYLPLKEHRRGRRGNCAPFGGIVPLFILSLTNNVSCALARPPDVHEIGQLAFQCISIQNRINGKKQTAELPRGHVDRPASMVGVGNQTHAIKGTSHHHRLNSSLFPARTERTLHHALRAAREITLKHFHFRHLSSTNIVTLISWKTSSALFNLPSIIPPHFGFGFLTSQFDNTHTQTHPKIILRSESTHWIATPFFEI